jgi:hypothetical protein
MIHITAAYIILILKKIPLLGTGLQACNPSYSGGSRKTVVGSQFQQIVP